MTTLNLDYLTREELRTYVAKLSARNARLEMRCLCLAEALDETAKLLRLAQKHTKFDPTIFAKIDIALSNAGV